MGLKLNIIVTYYFILENFTDCTKHTVFVCLLNILHVYFKNRYFVFYFSTMAPLREIILI